MNNFFIYKFNYNDKIKGVDELVSATVIFCDRRDIHEENLRDEIAKFYQRNYQTDRIFVVAGDYLEEEVTKVFLDNQDLVFKGIPKRQETFLSDNLFLTVFDKNGSIRCINKKKISSKFFRKFINEGLQNIFINRGGLVTSHGAHHYVFPSGKHCDKFLRTGNILLNSSEIYFIAFALLNHFDENIHRQIYCDTSSINSVAFALADLKNRFLEKPIQVSIESFSSYDGLYTNELSYGKQALLLISASTSANIITYILNKQRLISRENIVIMFFLGDERSYLNVMDKVLCNLTQSPLNLNGIPPYDTYREENCKLCHNGSYPVEVTGDVFLLENPKVNRIVLTVTDAEKNLSSFVQQFMSKGQEDTVLKVNYKEGSNPTHKYEVYIDFVEVLTGLKNHSRYSRFQAKLNDHINQYIPTTTRYLVVLNDDASRLLAEYVLERIQYLYATDKIPSIISQDEIGKISQSDGAVVVIGSCISNGKNLLYISRALRKFDSLRIVYFLGITRMRDFASLDFLMKNLKQGTYGKETNSFVEIDRIYCCNESKATPWVKELDFLKAFIDFILDEIPEKTVAIDFIRNRRKMIEASGGDHKKGLSDMLFYPRIINGNTEELKIRKNFAFFNFNNYDEDVTQSDI